MAGYKMNKGLEAKNTLSSATPGTKARAAEKKESARLRGRGKFNDQSNVEKLYRWLTKERPYYQNPFTGEKVPPPRD